MKRFTYTIDIEPAAEGGFVVTVPALPGCVTEGDTYEQAIANAHEAIEGFIEALVLAGEEVPVEPTPRKTVHALVQVEAQVAA